MGIINAALNWRKLRDLQRDYNNNQVFWKDWNNRGDNGLDASNGSNPRPEDPNGGGSSPSFRIITEDEATAFNEYLSKWNNAATKFGFNAATDEASLDASTRDVWNAVFSGKLKPDEAIALYTESGLRPEASQRIVNGILQTKAQYPDLANVKPETLESLPQPTRQPQTFEFPMDWKDPLYSNPQTRTPTTTQTPVTFAEPPNPPEIVVVPDTPILGTASPTFGNVPALPPYRQTDSAGGIGNLYQDMHTLLGKLNGQTPAQEPAPQDLGTMTQNARTLLERLKGRLPESPAETQPQTPQIPPLGRKLSEDERFGRRLSRYANTLNNAENTPNLIGRLLELGKMLAESPHHLGKSLREDAQYIEELYKSKPDLQPSTPITPLGLEQTPANEQWNDDDYYQSEDRKPKKENLGSMRGFAEPKPDIVRGIPYSGPRSVRGIPDGHPSTSHSTEGLEDILQPPTPLITPLGQRFPANEQWDDDDYYSSSAGDNSQPWQDIPDTHLPDTHQQEHFISLDEILHKHLRNLPKRDDNPEEHDRLIDEAERKQENAKAHNLQLFRQVESPEKLTELL
ncbi:MAG: hypothetical protein II877_05665, partial [Synergistaceae bacterium]|nr:hypothetical protein [Synergistaceae bacterium]